MQRKDLARSGTACSPGSSELSLTLAALSSQTRMCTLGFSCPWADMHADTYGVVTERSFASDRKCSCEYSVGSGYALLFLASEAMGQSVSWQDLRDSRVSPAAQATDSGALLPQITGSSHLPPLAVGKWGRQHTTTLGVRVAKETRVGQGHGKLLYQFARVVVRSRANWVAYTAEICCLTALEARSWRSRHGQSRAPSEMHGQDPLQALPSVSQLTGLWQHGALSLWASLCSSLPFFKGHQSYWMRCPP